LSNKVNVKKIFLLDLDNVLVYPGGYREALKATVHFFSRAMGAGDGFLDDAAIETFEAHGITSEWDSSAICVAVLLVELIRANDGLLLSSELDTSLSAICKVSPSRPNLDLATWARRIARAIPQFGYPSDAALSTLLEEVKKFSLRPQIEILLHALLDHTRDFSRSPAMRVFQQYTLGSKGFSKHYGMPAAFETPSCICAYDRPALLSKYRDVVLDLCARGSISAAIYTSRPCWPLTLPGRVEDYSPEAELALDLVGLKTLPLVGAGHTAWLAAQHNQRPEQFIKPSPVHALAAIGMALGGNERAALEAALFVTETQKLRDPLDVLHGQQVEIHIFEDSTVGIQGVRDAASHLQKAGVIATLKEWGIATNPEKRQALKNLGVPTFDDINHALEAAVER
jgi:hypothetical protein